MKDFQQRVVDEKEQLDERHGRLIDYISGGGFNRLPVAERVRLRRQLIAMRVYSDILGERIDCFRKEAA